MMGSGIFLSAEAGLFSSLKETLFTVTQIYIVEAASDSEIHGVLKIES